MRKKISSPIHELSSVQNNNCGVKRLTELFTVCLDNIWICPQTTDQAVISLQFSSSLELYESVLISITFSTSLGWVLYVIFPVKEKWKLVACHVIKVVKTNSAANYLSEIFGFGSPLPSWILILLMVGKNIALVEITCEPEKSKIGKAECIKLIPPTDNLHSG